MSTGRVHGVLVDLPESLAPAELAQQVVCVLFEPCEVEGSGYGLNAVEPPRLSVVDRICSYKVGYLGEGGVVQLIGRSESSRRLT